jgi:hypothetical protein
MNLRVTGWCPLSSGTVKKEGHLTDTAEHWRSTSELHLHSRVYQRWPNKNHRVPVHIRSERYEELHERHGAGLRLIALRRDGSHVSDTGMTWPGYVMSLTLLCKCQPARMDMLLLSPLADVAETSVLGTPRSSYSFHNWMMN